MQGGNTMNIQATDDLYNIGENQLMRIDNARGWVLCCQDGWLLVTQPGFARDFVLRKGDSLCLDTDGRVLVGGGASARFKLGPPHTAGLYPGLIRERLAMAVC
jgi:hypothetical protein